MLRKLPAKKLGFAGTTIKTIIVAESLLFVGGFGVWYALCNNQAFRFKMHTHCRPVLNGFYSVLEKAKGESPKTSDYVDWKISVTEDS